MSSFASFTQNAHSFWTSPSPSFWSFLSVFFVNFLIVVIVTFVMTQLFSIEINKKNEHFYWLLMGIGTFIPGFGILIIVIAVILLWRYGKDFFPIETNIYTPHEYTRKKPIEMVAHGAGWASVRLESTEYSHQERTKALYGIGKTSPKESNVLYAKLVSDEIEELRVCAFSLLEAQQDLIQNHINRLLKVFDKTIKIKDKAFIAKQLALLYWELVYRNLSDREFKQLMIERSTYFFKIAQDYFENDTTLAILMAKIYIEKSEFSEAWQKLIDALMNEATPSKVVPYLAEISYKNKDYEAVRSWLSSDNSLRYLLKLNKIVTFWCKK